MDVTNLRENHHILISYMEDAGYSKYYIAIVVAEIRHILKNHAHKDWQTYNDVYLEYENSQHHYSEGYINRKHRKYTVIGIIERFDVKGEYPNGRGHPIQQKYDLLVPNFKSVVDLYLTEVRGIKESTIKTNSRSIANFLWELQERGINSIQEITEKAVVSVFVTADGKALRGYTIKSSVATVFKTIVHKDPKTFNKILAYLPPLKRARKIIWYV